jgi:hypothetical protein
MESRAMILFQTEMLTKEVVGNTFTAPDAIHVLMRTMGGGFLTPKPFIKRGEKACNP